MGGQHHTMVTLALGKKPVTHCIGGWVGPIAGHFLKIDTYDAELFELMCSRNQFSVFHSSFKVTVLIQTQ
jgi:hypothetical protein